MFNWQDINEKLVKKIEEFCEHLVSLNKDDIVSINLFSESAESSWQEIDIIKLLVILKEISFEKLKLNLDLVNKAKRKGIVVPLFLTINHINSSSDVFPIEFWDMKDRHVTIYGQDILKDIKIEDMNLRLQCEQEIKGKLIKLRQTYLQIGLRKKEIKRLIYESFQSFIPVFRNMIRLKAIDVPKISKEVLSIFEKEFDIDISVFYKIMSLEFKQLKGSELEDFFSKYIKVIEEIGRIVDKLKII